MAVPRRASQVLFQLVVWAMVATSLYMCMHYTGPIEGESYWPIAVLM